MNCGIIGIGKIGISSNLNQYMQYFNSDCISYYKSGDKMELSVKIEHVINHYEIYIQKSKHAYSLYKNNFSWGKMMNNYIKAINY